MTTPCLFPKVLLKNKSYKPSMTLLCLAMGVLLKPSKGSPEDTGGSQWRSWWEATYPSALSAVETNLPPEASRTPATPTNPFLAMVFHINGLHQATTQEPGKYRNPSGGGPPNQVWYLHSLLHCLRRRDRPDAPWERFFLSWNTKKHCFGPRDPVHIQVLV